MKPIIFKIFTIPVYAYGFMLTIAFLGGIFYTIRQAKKENIPSDLILDLAIYVCIGAIIGSRLVYVWLEWPMYKDNLLSILNFRLGGLSFHGGFFGGLLMGIWFVRKKNYSPWKFADMIAPYIPLGYAITRIGCFLNGCCYGIPYRNGQHFHYLFGWICSEADWNNYFHHLSVVYRYPTQIYAIILNLIIFSLLHHKRNHNRFPGYLMFLYVIYYSIYRFIVEIFRESTVLLFGWLRTAQLASLILALAAWLAIVVLDKRYKNMAGTGYGKERIAG